MVTLNMAIWDSWFGGHDADMPGGPGFIRRRFYDNIRHGFKISRSKSRGPKAELGDFVRNMAANVGALGLVAATGGGSMIPTLVGAKGFINFGQGISSISSHKRSAELLDHALGGSLSRKYGNLNLSREGQSTVRTLFGGMGLGGGVINLDQITALVNNDVHRDNVRAILTDALQDHWVNPANGQVEKLEQHEKAELSSLFGLAFLDHWSRNRMHTEAHIVDNGIGTLLQNGSASGKSFYQSLKGNRAREEAFAKTIIEPSGLNQNEKDFMFHVLEAQKDADMGTAGSFNKILGGALVMGIAGYADGHFGHGAQQAQLDELRNAVQQHNELFQSIHENLNIRLDTQTGAAMVGNKIHLQGILSRGTIDPQLSAGFLTKGAHTQFGSMDSLSPAQIAAHQGILVQKIHALAQYSPFVKDVTAHVDWGNAGPLLGELKSQAALAAAGQSVAPGWAAILGLLTGADPKTLPGVQLPPGHEKIVEPYEEPYGTGDNPYETPYTSAEEPYGDLNPAYEIPTPKAKPARRTPRRSKTRPTRTERPAPIAGFHPQFGPIFMGQFNYAPFHYNPHIAPGVPHPGMLGHAAPVMFPGAFAHASAYAGYGPAMHPGAFAHASAHAGYDPMMFPGAYAHASAYAGHGMGMPMAPVAGAGAGMFGPMAFGHAAPVAFAPGPQHAHAYASAHAFAGVGYPHAAMPPMYNMFAPQYNFAPQFHWGQMQNHMHEWLGGYAAEWMKKYGPQPPEGKPTAEHAPYGAHEPEAEGPYEHGEPYGHQEGYEHMGPEDAHAYGAPAPVHETLTPYQAELPHSLEQPGIRSSRKARKSVGRALDRLVERGHFPAPYAMGHEAHETYASLFASDKEALHGLAGVLQHPSLSGPVYDHLPSELASSLYEARQDGPHIPVSPYEQHGTPFSRERYPVYGRREIPKLSRRQPIRMSRR